MARLIRGVALLCAAAVYNTNLRPRYAASERLIATFRSASSSRTSCMVRCPRKQSAPHENQDVVGEVASRRNQAKKLFGGMNLGTDPAFEQGLAGDEGPRKALDRLSPGFQDGQFAAAAASSRFVAEADDRAGAETRRRRSSPFSKGPGTAFKARKAPPPEFKFFFPARADRRACESATRQRTLPLRAIEAASCAKSDSGRRMCSARTRHRDFRRQRILRKPAGFRFFALPGFRGRICGDVDERPAGLEPTKPVFPAKSHQNRMAASAKLSFQVARRHALGAAVHERYNGIGKAARLRKADVAVKPQAVSSEPGDPDEGVPGAVVGKAAEIPESRQKTPNRGYGIFKALGKRVYRPARLLPEKGGDRFEGFSRLSHCTS